MTQLFLDQEPVQFDFEKVSSETMLPEDPNTWPNEILQEVYKQVSYISDFTPRVVPAKIDGEKGYGFGHIEVMSKTQAPNPTREQEQAAGIRHARIPFLIKDRKLMALDLVLTEGSKLLPLTETRLRQALFRPQTFDVTTKTPGDISLIGQLYPPHRQYDGFGGGGGMGKMGEWLSSELQKKASEDTEGMLRRIRSKYLAARKDPVGTIGDLVEKMSSTEFRDPSFPYEDRRITGPNPDYAGIKGPDNKLKKTAGPSRGELIGAAGGALGGLAGGAYVGHRIGSKDRPGRDNLSGKYRTKKSSMLAHLLPTINESDFNKLASMIDVPEVKLAFLQNTAAAKALAPLASYQPVPVEKRAAAMFSILKHNVAQINRVGDGTYNIKIASHRFWDPQTTRVDRGQLVSLVGVKTAMDVDTTGSVTVSDGEVADSPEKDILRPITDFGLYRVRSVEGKELVGYVFPNLIDSNGTSVPLCLFTNGSEASLQSDIVGVKVGEGTAIPEGTPQGRGAFFRITSNGKAEAMVPMELKGMIENDLVLESFDGIQLTAKAQPNIETFTVLDNTLLLPLDVHWLDLSTAQPVRLQDRMEEVSEKEAMAKLLTVHIRASSPDSFGLEGMPLQKMGHADTQMLSFDDAAFLLAAMGVKPTYAMQKLSEAAFGQKPIPVVVNRIVKKASDQMQEAHKIAAVKLASSRIPKTEFLVKEAAVIPDSSSVDAVLSLGFLNEENVFEFLKALPVLDEAQARMSELLWASRIGLKDVPEQALERAIKATEKVIEGLKILAFTEN